MNCISQQDYSQLHIPVPAISLPFIVIYYCTCHQPTTLHYQLYTCPYHQPCTPGHILLSLLSTTFPVTHFCPQYEHCILSSTLLYLISTLHAQSHTNAHNIYLAFPTVNVCQDINHCWFLQTPCENGVSVFFTCIYKLNETYSANGGFQRF
jgi:hypothetical protein